MKYRILVGALTCLAAAPSHDAFGQTVNWGDSFLLRTSGGFENPLLRVAFNPQPEPPIGMLPPEMDLSEPTMPRITVPDSSYSGGAMRILFAVEEGFEIVAEGIPDNEEFTFEILGSGPSTVVFNIASDSGGVATPGTWIAFNPQPEPPALGEGAGSIAFDFSFTSNSPAAFSLQILSDGVEPLSFSQELEADFDSDGNVDSQDLKRWKEAYGGGARADADGDGDSDGGDFLFWQRRVGLTSAAAPASVPEPSGALLATLAGAIALGARPARGQRFEVRAFSSFS